jgi:bifunctional non-homologous end joining protein LigD
VFDHDPGDRVEWTHVVAAARRVRDALAILQLESWVKTTGGRGLHVVVPFRPENSWDDVFAFSRALAVAIARDDPDAFTTSFVKADRVGKTLIDYKRNHRTSIAVAGFSTRARPEGTVSVPLRWSEVSAKLRPSRFTIATIGTRLTRLEKSGDPWQDFWRTEQRLPLRG